MRSHPTRKTTVRPSVRPSSAAVEYFTRKLEFDIGPYTLRHILDDNPNEVQVVDVRDAAAYEAEHIRSAVSIPLAEISSGIANLPKDKTIVTYCGDITCPLSSKAALEFAKAGFKVQHLVGGIAEWTKKGYPVDAGASETKREEGEGGPME